MKSLRGTFLGMGFCSMRPFSDWLAPNPPQTTSRAESPTSLYEGRPLFGPGKSECTPQQKHQAPGPCSSNIRLAANSPRSRAQGQNRKNTASRPRHSRGPEHSLSPDTQLGVEWGSYFPCFSETESLTLVQTGLKLSTILLPQPPKGLGLQA